MFRFTIRDVLWLGGATFVAIALIALGQSGGVATVEGNLLTFAAITVVLFAVTRVTRLRSRT
jgi:hypothetical protein